MAPRPRPNVQFVPESPPPPDSLPAHKSSARTPDGLPFAGQKRPLPKFKKTGQPKPIPSIRLIPDDVEVAVQWPDGRLLLGVGTTYRPPPPEECLSHATGFGGDGLWRWHEYTRQPQLLDHTAPFMAWAHLPTLEQKAESILYRRASRHDCALCPDAAVEQRKKLGGKKKFGMGTRNGMYRLTDQLYDELKSRHTALRGQCELVTDLLKRASKECMQGLNPESVIRVILANVREPVREYFDIIHACERLRYGCISAFPEFDVCFTAYQRAHNIMLAYFDFACSILPPHLAPGLAELPKLTQSDCRRGVVLAGEDIKTYIRFFKAHKIPVWVYAAMNTLAIPKGRLGPPDSPRCDVSTCDVLNDFKQRSLPSRWYPPPPHCPWALIEPIGRGYLPPPDQDYFELGQEAQKKKRKLDRVLQREEDVRVANKRKLENLKKVFGNLGSSLERYQQMAARSPAAQRYFANKLKPRPPFAPAVDRNYLVALDAGSKHIDLLTRPLQHPVISTSDPNFHVEAPKIPRDRLDELVKAQHGDLKLRTWVPPLSVFTNPYSWQKTVEMVCNAVTLLPTALERITVARRCSDVQPLSPAEWRDILTVKHWKNVWHDHHRKKYIEDELAKLRRGEDWDEANAPAARKKLQADQIPMERYDHNEFDKYGSAKYFGQTLTDNKIASLTAAGENTCFTRGYLACGHPATSERLVEDPDLIHNILIWLEQLEQLYWLCDLNSQALARDGILGLAGGGRRTPDFTDEEERQRPFVALILQSVIHRQVVGLDGWPAGGKQAEETFEAQYDVSHLTKVLISADHALFVDQYMERDLDWYTVQDLKDLIPEDGEPFASLDDDEFNNVQEQLLLRYILTSFAARQWPVEMVQLPEHDINLYKCKECRPEKLPVRREEIDPAAALSVSLGVMSLPSSPGVKDLTPNELNLAVEDTGIGTWFEYEPDPFWETYDGHLSDEPVENEGFSD
ncbi:unnamed protein product [Peniophora sp. CBMAI 1063]|nr:unnamed protein product [Peniophora sp. CBMAI 1063]